MLYDDVEFEALRTLYARSMCRTFSSYVRKVSIEEPVAVALRNVSFDGFVEEVAVLRKEMKQIYQEGKLDRENQQRLVVIHEEIKLLIDKISELCMPH